MTADRRIVLANKVDDYLADLSGWQAEVAATLRHGILAAGGVIEDFKWGHPVYEAGGPVCLFKAHKDHVTLGFWRGADMSGLEPRLVPHGSFQMASIKITKPSEIADADIAPLVAAGIKLNREKGDPLKQKKG